VEEEQPRAVPLAQRRGERRARPQQRGERDQEQVEPVHAERVADPQLRDPVLVRDVLEPAPSVLVVGDHHGRVAERDERADDGQHSRRAPRQERSGERDDQRGEDDYRQVDRHADTIRK
jgi:hypothetical protein